MRRVRSRHFAQFLREQVGLFPPGCSRHPGWPPEEGLSPVDAVGIVAESHEGIVEGAHVVSPVTAVAVAVAVVAVVVAAGAAFASASTSVLAGVSDGEAAANLAE